MTPFVLCAALLRCSLNKPVHCINTGPQHFGTALMYPYLKINICQHIRPSADAHMLKLYLLKLCFASPRAGKMRKNSNSRQNLLFPDLSAFDTLHTSRKRQSKCRFQKCKKKSFTRQTAKGEKPCRLQGPSPWVRIIS